MGLIMMDNFFKIAYKDMESIHEWMEDNMKANERLIIWKEKGNINGRMENYILEIIWMIRDMVKECFNGRMELSI